MRKLFLILGLLPLMFVSCSKDDSGRGDKEKFIGFWALLDYDEDDRVNTVSKMYEFKADGLFVYMGDTYDAPRDVEFREGSVYNYDPSYFRYKENGTYSFKGNKLILKNDTFYEEADYVFYDDDQLKIHCTYGWYIEDGKKVEEESYDEYIIIHRVNKFF